MSVTTITERRQLVELLDDALTDAGYEFDVTLRGLFRVHVPSGKTYEIRVRQDLFR
jgi:hypothetical protein